MAKKTLKTPGLAVRFGAAGALPSTVDAMAPADDFGAKFAGFNITENDDKIDSTTAEDEGFRSYIEGLTDFNVELMFKGGDTMNDYYRFRQEDVKGQVGYFIVYQNRGVALSGENYAWGFYGKAFELSLPGEIGSPQDFTVTVSPSSGGSGVKFVDATNVADLAIAFDPTVVTP